MGAEIRQTDFSAAEFARFEQRLQQNLAALRQLLARPGFGHGQASLGAELELCLIDARGRPLPRNMEVQAAAAEPRLTHELTRFNLEYNLAPVPAASHPFDALEREMRAALDGVNAVAARFGGRVIPIGILPTLRRRDFGPASMTPLARYAALSQGLRRIRGERFAIRIDGAEPLSISSRDVSLEGANTSLQIHWRVEPAAFARSFNAAQLATPIALALACNSPLLLGHRLWQETRVPLFKLAVDGRDRDSRELHLPPRVDFGSGWVREGVHELFAAAVHLHQPLLPLCSRENALARLRAGRLPQLRELRLHQGTLWPWNRPIYDHADGGHLRIEMRALPAGPSAPDMLANAAFLLGLAAGLAPRIDTLLPSMPFATATRNFYRAAQHGLEARLLWPQDGGALALCSAAELAQELLPLAARGLAALGIAPAESRHYLGLVKLRLARGLNGAGWQLRQLARLDARHPREAALRQLVQHYARHSLQHLPVADWPDIR